MRIKNPKVMNSLTECNSTKLLPRWTSASFIALSLKKIWSNYLKLTKMSTSKTWFLKSWWSRTTYKASKFIYPSCAPEVLVEQRRPGVLPSLHRPEVHVNDVFTFCYFFCWFQCFPKLTAINHCKHSPALHPPKDVKTKSVLQQQFFQLENYFSKKGPNWVKLWDHTCKFLVVIVL